MTTLKRLSFAKDASDLEVDTVRSSIVIAGPVCGTGKTTLARAFEYFSNRCGQPLQVATVDFFRDQKVILPPFQTEVEQLTSRANSTAGSHFDMLQDDHWTRFGDRLAQGGQLIDLEGHLMNDAIAWAKCVKPRNVFERLPTLSVVLPVSTSRKSIVSTEDALKRLMNAEPDLTPIKPVVAFNDCIGQGWRSTKEIDELREFVRMKGFTSFDVPHGDLRLASSYSFADLATFNAHEFARRLGVSPMTAQTKLQSFRKWLDEVEANMRAVGLIPKVSNAKQAA